MVFFLILYYTTPKDHLQHCLQKKILCKTVQKILSEKWLSDAVFGKNQKKSEKFQKKG